MATNEIVSIEKFIELTQQQLLIDVRSPAEYQKGHIPGAISQPLFSNDERAIIGTLYKNKGKHAAMLEALNYYGKNVQGIVSYVLNYLKQNEEFLNKPVLVHCWRGGMRSGVVCWMLNLFGIPTIQLRGGYKAYRNYVLNQFEIKYFLNIVGGKTGSNKTGLLKYMKSLGRRVIDLEELAHHRGSAFGNLGKPAQPTQEQFENELCNELTSVANDSVIWLEDESQAIGTVNIPGSLWQQMRKSKVYYLDIPRDKRLLQIIKDYGEFPIDELINRTIRITKKLGGLNTKICIQHLQENHLKEAFDILLQYYDKLYDKATSNREPQSIITVSCSEVDPLHLYFQLMQLLNESTD